MVSLVPRRALPAHLVARFLRECETIAIVIDDQRLVRVLRVELAIMREESYIRGGNDLLGKPVKLVNEVGVAAAVPQRVLLLLLKDGDFIVVIGSSYCAGDLSTPLARLSGTADELDILASRSSLHHLVGKL